MNCLARSNRFALAPAAVLAACGLVLLPPTTLAEGGSVIAKVGKTEVSTTDIQAFLSGIDPAVRQQAATNRDVLMQIVRNHLSEIALYNEARAKGWDKRPEIQARIEQAAHEVVMRSYLTSLAKAPADFPSDKEVQAVYDQHKDSFMSPRTYRISQIFVPISNGSDKAGSSEAQRKIADLLKEVRSKGADFAAIAKANTSDPKLAASGGDLGFIPEDQLLPEIRYAVSTMAKGDTSDPIRLQPGYVIVHLTDTKAAEVRPFNEVSDQIRARMRQVREKELARTYIDNMVKNNPITINEIELSKIGDSLK